MKKTSTYKILRPFRQNATSNGRATVSMPHLHPTNPRYRYLQHDLWILEKPIVLDQNLDYETQACIRLWLGKALAIMTDIVYPAAKDRYTNGRALKRGPHPKTQEMYSENLDYLQSEFLEEILEIAGCLELKQELIEPIVELHNYYNA